MILHLRPIGKIFEAIIFIDNVLTSLKKKKKFNSNNPLFKFTFKVLSRIRDWTENKKKYCFNSF